MENEIIFGDKTHQPDETMLRQVLGKTYPLWLDIRKYVHTKYTGAKEQWKYPGAKYGWSFSLHDKKRAILYLIPRKTYFQVAFVFGQKATDHVLASKINPLIKHELESARVYAEGRGIRLVVKNKKNLEDIRELIDTKLSF